MARPLRVEFPGALYHVVNRGNRRERVFRSQADYALFLDRLERFAETFDVAVLSYCLMANHFHLSLSGFTSVRDRLERRLAGRRHPLAVPYGQVKAVLSHSRQNDEMKLIAEV
ncbi:MAG: transposase [Lentisphaeria bacterium]